MKYSCNIKKKSRSFLLFFFLIFSGCSTASRFELFYSGNLNGIIEDCRCPRSSQGSILNHYTFYKDSIQNRTDAGYLSTGNIYAYSRSDRENLLIGEIISELGIDYIVPGRNDFSFIGQMDGIETISYNLSGAREYIFIEAGNIKIALTGMIDQSYSKYSNADVILDKNLTDLTVFIKQLKAEADIVIFVSNIGSDTEKDIFNRITEIDVMISNTNEKNEEFRFGDRLYASPGMFGEYFGKLVITGQDRDLKLRNSFTKLTFEKFKDDPVLKEKTDSLKLKHGIKEKFREEPDGGL
ncbi:MAG: hypothetical protein JXN63_04325 [Candidatus Delongbacteria bacterium]|nr:hypothetical protein [Candidatus Delongbacteria bacterium]